MMNKFLFYINDVLESLDIYPNSNSKRLEPFAKDNFTKNNLKEN